MNVTLKEFPTDLHSRLKALAEGNGRSLNKQIIYLLESATTPQKTDESILLQRIKVNRKKMMGPMDPAFLSSAISEGRL